MRVYARRSHRYTDLATKREYFFPERGWIDVPDDVGRLVTGVHPDKLVDISQESDPDRYVSELNAQFVLDAPEPSPTAEPDPVPAPVRRRTSRPRTTPLGSRGRS